MDLPPLNWNALDRLRAGFLNGVPPGQSYWQSESDLAAYDATYATRIGWKWDAVLGELQRLGWAPPASAAILDWGCGSGIAGRRFIETFGPASFSCLRAWDHSPLAMDFALKRAANAFPGLATARFHESDNPPDILLLSHVLNELEPTTTESLLRLATGSKTVIWVEPGTHADSHRLGEMRRRLLPSHQPLAPCPHAVDCGMFAVGNERHWCHFFAPCPTGIQNSSDWVRFGQRAGIDLRSLPYSYLVMQSKSSPASPPLPDPALRLIGRPEVFKGFARVLACEKNGVLPLELQKRTDPPLFKELDRRTSHPVYSWHHDSRRVTST